jgi:hypothetical protein
MSKIPMVATLAILLPDYVNTLRYINADTKNK